MAARARRAILSVSLWLQVPLKGVLYTGNFKLKSACMCMYALLCSMYLSVYFMYLYVCICIGLYSDNTCMYSVVCACMCMYVNEINKKWLSVERAYLYV